jgi:hypothetical protein
VYNHGLSLREAAARSGSSARGAMSLRDFQTVRPSVDALWERLRRDITDVNIPKGARPEPLNVESVNQGDASVGEVSDRDRAASAKLRYRARPAACGCQERTARELNTERPGGWARPKHRHSPST